MDTSWDEVSLVPYLKYQAVVSMVESSIAYPLDVLKTRHQAVPSPPWAKSQLAFFTATVRNFGIRDFFPGFRYAVVGGNPSELGYYVTYNVMKKRIGDHPIGHALSGAAAEASVLLLWVPMDIISQHQQVENVRHRYFWWPRTAKWNKDRRLHQQIWYGTHGHLHAGAEASGLKICRHLQKEYLRNLGVQEKDCGHVRWKLYQVESFIIPLYRGTLITAFVRIPLGGIHWGTYEFSKKYAAAAFGETLLGSSLAGFFAGATSALFTNPLDVMKTRYQTMSSSHSMKDILVGIVKDRHPGESIFAPFLRGSLFRVGSYGIRSAFALTFYEAALYLSRG